MGNFPKFDGKGQEETVLAWDVRRVSRPVETVCIQKLSGEKAKEERGRYVTGDSEGRGSPRQLRTGARVLSKYQVLGLR